MKKNIDDVHTIPRLISYVQTRLTGSATITPKQDPTSHAGKSKTAMRPTAMPKSASSLELMTKFNSACSRVNTLVTPTTAIDYTSDVCIGSTTLPISRWTSWWPRGDSAVPGGSATDTDTIWSVVMSTILSPKMSPVLGKAHLPRFDLFLINRSGGPLQWPFFWQKDMCNPSPLSLIEFNSRSTHHSSTSMPTHSVLGGTVDGNQCQKAHEDHIILWFMLMADNHLVDIVEKLKTPAVQDP